MLKEFLFKEKNKNGGPAVEVNCPYCEVEQVVSQNSVSAFCKRCKRIFNVKKVIESQYENQEEIDIKPKTSVSVKPEKNYSTDSKIIICSSCRTKQDVPTVAISTFCKKCGQRINLQDYKKNDFFRGDIETKGALYITASGNVNGNVCVGEAIIDGKFSGKLVSDGLVKLQPGSFFSGELYAPKLEVYEGAVFVGSSVVKPDMYIVEE